MSDTHQTLSALIRTVETAGDGDQISVADIIEALGPRSFGSVLLVPSLILMSPLSAIPGASTFGAIIIVLVGLQMAAGMQTLWLPDFIRSRALSRSRVRSAMRGFRPVARLVDRITSRRFTILTRWPFSLVLVLPCIVIALAMPPLELVPMSSTILATAIFLLALSLTANDGFLGLLALAAAAAAVGMGFGLLL